LRGYVIILVEGFFPEKFINVCINRGLVLWDINKRGMHKVTLKASIKAFKEMKPIARKTRCKLVIKAKKGFPFMFHRYQKRKTFLAGCIIFLGMIYFLSSFIWSIDVSGNKKVKSQDIIDNLKAIGIKAGSWKPFIDEENIANKMLMRMKQIAWINVDIRGTRAKVEVVERVIPKNALDSNVPCNIVAKKNGVIDSIIFKKGTTLVKVGDSVKIGDLLVSGIVVNEYDKSVRYVHASALVSSRTWYEKIQYVPYERVKQKTTGKVSNKYKLILFDKTIGVENPKPPFRLYDKNESIKKISLGKNYTLPFGMITETYIEKVSYKEKLSVEQAKAEAGVRLAKEISEMLPKNANIRGKKIFYAQGKKAIRARMLVECLEDIGVEEKIN